ncbi:MAG: hypothetical protein LIP18_06935, partial [Planctomycetes bacterium]|nr:hypothetical protein [Planctomycetota bacterium]
MPYQHPAFRQTNHHHHRYRHILLSLLLLFVLPGCGGTTPSEPAGLRLRTGNLLYGPLDAYLADTIRVGFFGEVGIERSVQ